MIGSFSGDAGVFEGEDMFEGRPILVRFVWSGVTTPTPRWEQAFSDDGGRTVGDELGDGADPMMFHVVVTRSGPEYDASLPPEEQSDWPAHASFMDGLVDSGFIVLGGPLDDEHRVVHAVEAESEEEVRATLAHDPWSESHLRVVAIEPWTIRLDAREV